MKQPLFERQAEPVCQQLQFFPTVGALQTPGVTAGAFLARLLYHQFHDDALRFLAHVLDRRLAVWWGCLCVRHVSGPHLPVPQEAALDAAVTWVLEQTDEARQSACEPGQAASLGTPAGCLALAAYNSAPPASPSYLPQAVARAVLSAAADDKAKAMFAATAFDVVRQRITWPAGKPHHA